MELVRNEKKGCETFFKLGELLLGGQHSSLELQ